MHQLRETPLRCHLTFDFPWGTGGRNRDLTLPTRTQALHELFKFAVHAASRKVDLRAMLAHALMREDRRISRRR
jgi:hypothetical protein